MPTESLPTYKVRKRGDLSSSSTSTKPTAKPDSTNPLVKKPSFSKNDSSASAGNSATSTTTAVAADQGLPKRVVKKSSEQALTSKLTRKSSIPTFKPSTKPIPPSTTSTALAEKFSTYISSTQIQKKLKVEHVKDLPAPKLSQPVNDQKQTGVVAELQLDRVSAKSKKRGLDETDEDNIYKPREVYTISKPPPNTPITLPTIQLKYPISLSRPRQTLATHYTDSELIALVVPEKYITLASIFEALEMTVSFMKARRMRCDFHRVQKPVEGASRRKFEMSHLGQIKTVYPEAYTYEPLIIAYRGERVCTIVIDYPKSTQDEAGNDGSESKESDKGKNDGKIECKVFGKNLGVGGVGVVGGGKGGEMTRIREQSMESSGVMKSTESMRVRKDEFRRRLVERVFEAHEKFLKEKGIAVPTKPIQKWHADFRLESVEDIPVSEMPRLASEVEKKKFNPFELGVVTKKKDDGGDEKKSGESEVEKKESSGRVEGKADGELKTKEMTMLERIREKERLKKEAAMTEVAGDGRIGKKQRQGMLERLPQIARGLYLYFSSKKKSALPIAEVTSQMIESLSNPISKAEMRAHFELLSEIAPTWCKLTSFVMKIDMTLPVHNTMELITKAQEE